MVLTLYILPSYEAFSERKFYQILLPLTPAKSRLPMKRQGLVKEEEAGRWQQYFSRDDITSPQAG